MVDQALRRSSFRRPEVRDIIPDATPAIRPQIQEDIAMSLHTSLAAAALLAALGWTVPTVAAPAVDKPSVESGVTLATGCHRDVERGNVPGYGRVWHYHRGENCRTVIVQPDAGGGDDDEEDCHREVRRHYVPEFGERVWHFHRGPNCRVVEVDRPDPEPVRDCHREVQRHYLPEYGGSVVHRHVGPNCRPDILRRYDPNLPRPGSCIQLGPIRYCDY
jgi:hypothetical protein